MRDILRKKAERRYRVAPASYQSRSPVLTRSRRFVPSGSSVDMARETAVSKDARTPLVREMKMRPVDR
jgi:hypothetical protein